MEYPKCRRIRELHAGMGVRLVLKFWHKDKDGRHVILRNVGQIQAKREGEGERGGEGELWRQMADLAKSQPVK